MFRFYLKCRPASPDDLSPASLSAWEACDQAFRQLSEAEREIVRNYYTQLPDRQKCFDPMSAVSAKHGMPIHDVKVIIDKAIRIAVVVRGLADE